ncbi:MAG: DUF2490 domain-containing protein [Ignavibacteriales bacterium]|nr:DUF2490 domain-containing protein [Ignavibacteriales bacterium]
MKRILAIHIFLLFCIENTFAQSTFIGGLFPTIDHSGTITKNLDYSLYYFGAFPLVNFKNPDISKDANFLLFYSEQALTFNVNKHLSFTGAYVYQRENVTKDNYSNENRVHIQTTYKHSVKTVNLKHRLRFDNRFIHDNTTDKTSYTHRLRYLIGLDFPIKSKKDNLYFTAYEEAFFNTFKNASAVYGENWAYAAIGTKLNDNNKLETGLLYITWNTGGNNWFHQYYLQLTWVSHLDFTKPKQTK